MNNRIFDEATFREEYRIAVRLWSETKALYPADSAELAGAAEHLAVLEDMVSHPEPLITEPLVPAQAQA